MKQFRYKMATQLRQPATISAMRNARRRARRQAYPLRFHLISAKFRAATGRDDLKKLARRWNSRLASRVCAVDWTETKAICISNLEGNDIVDGLARTDIPRTRLNDD